MFIKTYSKLARFPEDKFGVILPLLGDDDGKVRLAMVNVVRRNRIKEAVPVLEGMLRNEKGEFFRGEIEGALGEMEG